MRQSLQGATQRIEKMEAVFDALQDPSFREDSRFPAYLQTLLNYYENGQWLRDYALDEQGYLPNGLKRGVLSEDGIYNFLTELQTQQE